jgi:hypothetical protein
MLFSRLSRAQTLFSRLSRAQTIFSRLSCAPQQRSLSLLTGGSSAALLRLRRLPQLPPPPAAAAASAAAPPPPPPPPPSAAPPSALAAAAAAVSADGDGADDGPDLVADAAEEAAAEAADAAGGAAASRRAVMRVIRDLEQRNAVHAASMAAVERSREWRDYDAHAHLELGLLRLRYSEGEAMTAQRRAQMQAHLRAKQLEVMEEHASQAAEAFVRDLSPSEADELRATMLRIDGAGGGLGEGGSGGGGGDGRSGTKNSPGSSAFDDELRDALHELSVLLPQQRPPTK